MRNHERTVTNDEHVVKLGCRHSTAFIHCSPFSRRPGAGRYVILRRKAPLLYAHAEADLDDPITRSPAYYRRSCQSRHYINPDETLIYVQGQRFKSSGAIFAQLSHPRSCTDRLLEKEPEM